MPKTCFRKSLVRNAISFRTGVKVPFEPLADAMGVICIDSEAVGAADQIADLTEFARRKVGGVTPITEAEYEDLKKNHPFVSKASKLNPAPRLFDQSPDPFSQQNNPSAPVAAEAGLVGLAAVANPAESAGAQAGSSLPKSQGRKPKVGPPKGRLSEGAVLGGPPVVPDAPVNE